MYYFIETDESIPQAFADCLGGLMSIAAQNARLTLTGVDGVTIGSVHGKPQLERRSDTEVLLTLNDMYCEEARDILVELSLPGLPGPAAKPCELLRVDLEYFNVLDSSLESANATLQIDRPETLSLEQQNMVLDPYLEEQIARLEVATALESADLLGRSGDYIKAQEVLDRAFKALEENPEQSTFVQCLLQDIKQARQGFIDRQQYERYGSKMSKAMMKGHYYQRSNRAEGGAYRNSKKAQMVAEMSRQREEQYLPMSGSAKPPRATNATSADAYGAVEGSVFQVQSYHTEH